MRIFLFTILVVLNIQVLAQVSADFSLPAEICLRERLEPENTSINSTNYKWDFCTGDFNLTPASELFVSNIDYKTNNNISIYFDSKFDTVRYVFFPSGGAKKVFLFKMDDKLSQTFNSEELDLGSVSLGRPIDISIIKVDENYFGYLVDFNTNKLHEINFGENIENQPISVTDLGSFGSLNQPIAVKAIKEGGDIKIVIANYNSTNLTIVNKDLDGIYTHQNFNTGSNRGSDIDVLKVNGNVYGLMSFPTIGKVRVYNFGSAINSSPSLLIDYSNGAMPSPNNAKWIFESGKVKALVQSNNGNIGLMKMADDFLSVSEYLNYGKFGVLDNSTRGLSVHQNIHSEWHALVPTINTNIYKINFDNSCDVSPGLSIDENPLTSYSSSGTYPITLTASDENGNTASITKDINVNTGTAPTGDILLDSAYCITNNIIFSLETTDNIESYLWDFGDGNSSVAVSPSHQYINAGNYMITLEIEDDPGCTNTYTRMVEIADEPSTGFSTAKTEYCTFETIDFINTTSGDFGENVNWNWDFNGEGSSSVANPSFVFETVGSKIVTLEADVLGCVETYQFTLEIIEAPEVDYIYDRECLGESIQFTNTSGGDNITGYEWSFGNGESSTEENPQIIYNIPGTYPVALTVSNASGCENTIVQNIKIFDQIVDSIKSTEAIENLPFKLGIDWNDDFDSTQSLSYQWEIEGDIQSTDTANYTLDQGEYTINIEISTENGCLFNTQRLIDVIVSEHPIPDFILPSEICLDENILIENVSINSINYEWDFCQNDLTADSIKINQLIDNDNFDQPIGGSFINFQEEWYAFVVNEGDNSITRLDFGNHLNNNPRIVNLGNFGGQLDSPEEIKSIKFADELLLFVSNRNTNKLIRINVGSDINNMNPNSDVILSGPQDIFNNGIDVIFDGSNFIATYTASNFIRLVNLGDDPRNIPSQADNIRTNPINNITDIGDISFYQENNKWFALIVGYTSKTIVRLDFGSSLFSNPNTQLVATNNQFESKSPFGIDIVSEANKIFGYVSTASGDLVKLSFGESILNEPVFTDLGNFSILNRTFKTDIINYQSKFFGLSSDYNTNKIFFIDFLQDCKAQSDFLEVQNPVTSFSQPGTYPITLTAYHPNGSSGSITKEITVTDNQAPEISFNVGADLCITNPIQFNSESNAEISAYNWNFGDGESSTEANPEHLFSSAGDYIVQLSVTDTAGCNNLFQDSITIYAEPQPDFQVTAQGSLCSQKPVIFENLTNLPTEAVFLWEFGDGTSSTDENPDHIYAEAGEYIINFQIEMAGCLVEKTDTITVNPGPLVDFNYSDDCYGQVLNFENISTGDFLQNFQWSFGDGTQSTQTNPKHRYDSAGTYDVQLSAFTSNGCDYTFQQQVIVHPVATVAFEAGVACAEQPVQFTEQVALQQSNITDYLWDFGISGTTSDRSTEANPQFVFPTAGTFEVQLQVTTADGCTSTASQVVAVQALPQPSFTYEKNCLFNPILFSPENTENITSHFWELQNPAGELLFSAQSENFSYTFETPGSYQLRYRQENENLCSNTITETVEILPLPEPDFEVGNVCTKQNIFFENLTDLKGNNLEKYNWTIDGEVISTDFRPQYTFQNSGDFLLGLQVETESGCIQSISKTISVSESPAAFFELEQTLGAFPYVLSTSAEDYPLEGIIGVFTGVSWTLNGDTISTSSELNYTIEQEGTYLLGLIVTNEAGCTASHYEQIRIRKPNLDVALSNLRITQDQEFTSFVLNISNKGTLVPESLNLDIDLGSYSITETIEEPLVPEKSRNVALSIKLTEEQLRGLAKICIQAIPHNAAAAETNVSNNRVCTNLESGLKVMEIYPNPAATEFTLPIIIPENASVDLSLEQSNGQNVKTLSYDLEAGYNEIQINRDNLKPGIYFLRIRYQGEEMVKKIIFQ